MRVLLRSLDLFYSMGVENHQRILNRKRHYLSESHSALSDYSPWNSPVYNTGVCSLSLLQRIFPTQGLNPGLLHCRQILYKLSHKGNPLSELSWTNLLIHPYCSFFISEIENKEFSGGPVVRTQCFHCSSTSTCGTQIPHAVWP